MMIRPVAIEENIYRIPFWKSSGWAFIEFDEKTGFKTPSQPHGLLLYSQFVESLPAQNFLKTHQIEHLTTTYPLSVCAYSLIRNHIEYFIVGMWFIDEPPDLNFSVALDPHPLNLQQFYLEMCVPFLT